MDGLFDKINADAMLDAIRRREVSTDANDPNAPLMPMEQMVSPKGATGPMQIIPEMAMDPGYGVPDIFDVGASLGFEPASRDIATASALANDPQVAREYAKRYLEAMYDRFGTVDKAAAAYNLGPGGLLSAGQLHENLPDETKGYVNDVRRFYTEATGEGYPITLDRRPTPRPQGLLGGAQ
jgi:soluble lytic murein transglycosylase-like protein